MKDKEYYERVKRLYELAIIQLNEIGIYPSNNIKKLSINTRAKKRLGCCKAYKKLGKTEYEIEISDLLKDKNDIRLSEVIIHELLHSCPGCLNHGKKWKEHCELVRRELGYKITSRADYEKLEIPINEKEYKYEITCTNCGLKMYRQRKCNLVDRPTDYRCGKCNGKLLVTPYIRR